jgi:DNA-binding response OmpR family regulator
VQQRIGGGRNLIVQIFSSETWILVLEDQPSLVLELSRELGDAGAHVFAARTLKDALGFLETGPRLAVLSYQIGKQTCENVAADCRRRKIPFIMTSAIPAVLDHLGAAAWIGKPYAIPDLLSEVAKLVGESTYRSEKRSSH